jgi:hypothetical protein
MTVHRAVGWQAIEEGIPEDWFPLLVRLRGKSPAINGKEWLARALHRNFIDPNLESHVYWKANVGIVVPAGHIVIDPDNPAALARAEEELDPLGGPRAETGSGKAHHWFRLPKKLHGRVASGEFLFDEIRFDSKADGGGQVVIPPSLHPDTGRPYKWIRALKGTRIPMLPAEWCDALKAKGKQGALSKIRTTPWKGKLSKIVKENAREDSKLRALLELPVVEIPWLRDGTESQADLSLAYRLGLYGIDPSLIEHALRWRRARIPGRPKSKGYFAHTVAKALASVTEADA